jgi:hypothetical protein
MATDATRLLDAQMILVGWINHSATDCDEHIRRSGDVIDLGTDLDASTSFVMVASHPGAAEAVTVRLDLAPALADGGVGRFISACAVAIPAAGGKVEAVLAGGSLLADPADGDAAVPPPNLRYARASVSPSTPAGMVVALTAVQGV